jgi:hypothetical protein
MKPDSSPSTQKLNIGPTLHDFSPVPRESKIVAFLDAV